RMNAIVRRLGGELTKLYMHANVHPHVTFSRMDVYRLIQCVYPTGPNTCRYYNFMFSLRGPRKNPWAWLNYRFLRPIVVYAGKKGFREDGWIFRAVQQGREASPFPGVIGTREERIHFFQKFVLDRCPETAAPAEPRRCLLPLAEAECWNANGCSEPLGR